CLLLAPSRPEKETAGNERAWAGTRRNEPAAQEAYCLVERRDRFPAAPRTRHLSVLTRTLGVERSAVGLRIGLICSSLASSKARRRGRFIRRGPGWLTHPGRPARHGRGYAEPQAVVHAGLLDPRTTSAGSRQ